MNGWGRDRPADTRIFSPVHYQLSYPANRNRADALFRRDEDHTRSSQFRNRSVQRIELDWFFLSDSPQFRVHSEKTVNFAAFSFQPHQKDLSGRSCAEWRNISDWNGLVVLSNLAELSHGHRFS